MLEELKPCLAFKLTTTRINPNPKLITDKIDSTALSHKKSLQEEAVCSFPGANIIYLVFYCSTWCSASTESFKIHTQKKEKETYYQGTNKTIKPDSKIIQISELSDRDFTITMINIFKYLIEKVDILHEQMGNFSTEVETTRKS